MILKEWYVDDIKIIKASDESVVTYSEGFERIGYGWIAQNQAGVINWEAEGTQIYTVCQLCRRVCCRRK